MCWWNCNVQRSSIYLPASWATSPRYYAMERLKTPPCIAPSVHMRHERTTTRIDNSVKDGPPS